MIVYLYLLTNKSIIPYFIIQMMKHQYNLSASPQKDFQELINSIENKLELLASENFDVGQGEAFTNSLPLQLNYSPQIKQKQDLQLSDLCQTPSHSPILSRLQQIQKHYFSQLTALNYKLSILETENTSLKQQNFKQNQQILRLSTELEIISTENDKIIEKRLQELQQSLLGKIREEIEEEMSNYIVELQNMRKELNNERKLNKELEKENQIVINERDNYEGLYKDMIAKYKHILQSEIQSHQQSYREKEIKAKRYENHEYNTENNLIQKKEKQSKRKKGSKTSKVRASQLSKQELIPFLTKGIQELRQKLKIK